MTGTGLQLGLKLKKFFYFTPNQLLTSIPFAIAVDKPIILVLSPLELIKFIRLTITSSTGPLSCPNKWISSNIINPLYFTYPLVLQFLDIPSHFSGVVIKTSAPINAAKSGVKSPVNSKTTFFSYTSLLVQSLSLSLAIAFMGAM